MKTLHYYFALISPFSYLGHDELQGIVDRDDVKVEFHPVKVGAVFSATGGVPPAKRSPQRQALRFAELRRWSARKELPLNLVPKHFPVDESVAARCVLALVQQGQAPWEFIGRAHRAVWAEDRDLSDIETVRAVLVEAGQDADAILALAQSDEIGAAYDQDTEAAIEAGVFGAPTYVVGNELFWGQDRLDWVEAVLNE